MNEIPDSFWDEFRAKLIALSSTYNPVSLRRLYPFLVSRLSGKMVEVALSEAQRKGMVAIDVLEVPASRYSKDKVRVIRLLDG